MIPSLVDVSASAELLGRLSVSDTRAMPVSSNIAHAQSAAIEAAAAAAAAKHTAGVKRAYRHLGLKDIARISILPFPSSINPSEAAQQLTRSAKLSTSDILVKCDENNHEGIKAVKWIPGWEYPLQKSFERAITPDKPTTASLTAVMDDFFRQVLGALASGATGPAAFALLLRLLNTHFDNTDTGACYAKLHSFGVPNGTPFCDFSRAFRWLFQQRQALNGCWHRGLGRFWRWFGWRLMSSTPA